MTHSIPHPLRRQIRILLAIGFLALGVAGYSGWRLATDDSASFHGTAYPDSPLAPDFALTDHTGAPTSLAAHVGTPLLLFFGFTECPDVCPVTLDALSRVLREEELGSDEARILLITVDPERDSPDRLAAYISRYGTNVTGLTGGRPEIERVLAEYGVYASPGTGHDGHATIAHTPLVFGIDRTGRLRVLIHPEEGDDVIRDDVRALIGIG